MLFIELVLSVYKLFSCQVVCFHKFFICLVVMKGVMDLCIFVEQVTCTEFSNPAFLLLIRKAISAVFHSLFASVAICLSYVNYVGN